MDKKGEKKEEKPKQQKAPPKEEKKEETAEERRKKEEREALKEEKKLHKKEHQRHLHEAHAAGGVMDDLSKKQVFKKFNYRGKDIGKGNACYKILTSCIKNMHYFIKLKYKGQKPAAIKTHLRDCIVLPTMVQSVINVHNGKGYNSIEVKPEMIGYYLGEFAMTYKKVSHGKPGVGATHSSKFVPIK